LAWARRKKDDNYAGGDDNYASEVQGRGAERGGLRDRRQLLRGDDNYPRVVAVMSAMGREEGRGWNRQK